MGVSNKSCAVNNVSVFFSVALFLRSVPVKFLMCKFIYTIVFTLHKNSIQKDCDKTNFFRIRWSFHLRCKLYDVRSTTIFLQSKFHNPKNSEKRVKIDCCKAVPMVEWHRKLYCVECFSKNSLHAIHGRHLVKFFWHKHTVFVVVQP